MTSTLSLKRDTTFRNLAPALLACLLVGCESASDDHTNLTPASVDGDSNNLALQGRQIATINSTENGLLANPDFSEPLGNIPGWSACRDNNAIQIETNDRLARVGAQECILQIVEIQPSSTNSISCDVSASNPNKWSGMAISFYDANGQFISESDAARVTNTNATRLTSVGTAPSNTNAGLVWFYTESGGTIDNCNLVSTPADSNQQTYRKSLEVTTSQSQGAYGGFQYPGFGFNGFSALQEYSTSRNSVGGELIDGTESQEDDPRWRRWDINLGLAEGYLHVLTTIYKYNVDDGYNRQQPPLLLDSPEQIWHDESMEIYFNVGNESTAGYDDNDFVRVYRFGDDFFYTPETLTGINSKLNLSNSTACGYEEYGAISCEARFSLEEMGIDLSYLGAEAEIGFDVHMNFDDDGGNRDAKYSWCSGDTLSAWRDMSVVDCSLKLIQDCEQDCAGFGY